jgi:dTDP-4-amino-4,6-dideoxygalactose transaminase
MGDGGAITTNDNELAERVKQLRQYGWTERYFQGVPGGRNSRLDELQAGFLTVFLDDLDERNEKRRKIGERYVQHGATVVQGGFANSENYVAHLAVCTVNDRRVLINKFNEAGISTGIHYPYLDSEFATTQHLAKQLLPNSIAVKDKIVTLPCFPEMNSLELELVCSTITKCQQHFEVL